MEITNGDDLLRKFKEKVNKIFEDAERSIADYKFDLEAAMAFVTSLQQHVESYKAQNCLETDLETAVLARASQTASCVINGVTEHQRETYDPRQTVLCVFSALSVSSLSLSMVTQSGTVRYRHTAGGVDCLSHLDLLHFYCLTKGQCETPAAESRNTLWFVRLLVNLACWLERTRPNLAYFIVTQIKARYIVPFFDVPGMQTLDSSALVVLVSSWLRMGHEVDTKGFHRLLTRAVKVDDLPDQYAAKYNTVYAKILYSCGQYVKARDRARDALSDTKDEEERQELEQLLAQLESAISEAQNRDDGDADSEVSEEWLLDTNVGNPELCARQADEVRRNFRPNQRRRTRRRSSISQEVRSVSLERVHMHTGQRQESQGTRSNNLSRNHTAAIGRLSSSSLDISNTSRPEEPFDRDQASNEVPTYSHESETDDDECDEGNHQFIKYDDSDEEESDDSLSEEPTAKVVDDEKDWFDKSVEGLQTAEDNCNTNNEIELSQQQENLLHKNNDRDNFYYKLEKDADYLDELVKSNPDKYKRCQLKIEFSHRSTARVLDKGSKFSEILICGRSKCGQTYMDDEVVVEVLSEPGQARELQAGNADGSKGDTDVEKMAHGKVVGLYTSRRVRFKDEEYPVLICTLDEIESHLMRPLCNTVPKIHVMNDRVREKYPALIKYRLDIKQIVNGNIEFKKFFNIDPDKRQQYVFKVVMLSWRQQSIYPLGAILEARIGGRDFAGGLEVLIMQHSVPGVYPREVIRETQALQNGELPSKSGRLDLTAKRVFTIDPPGSQDLDDALSIWKGKSGFVVGVHIADVASFVKEGTAIDKEAKRRAVTFYPGRPKKPRPMLPEPLSHGKCSLLPGQERLALSVFFKFDNNGKLDVDEEPRFKKTVIKSARQFSYEEVQKVIDGSPNIDVDQDTRQDILFLHMIASQLRETHMEKGGLFVPFEDPRLHDMDNVAECIQAHSLIEEFMVLANASVAKRLRQKFPHVMILRSHKPPTYKELAAWREKEGNIANLVMQLQGKNTSPATKLSISAGAQGQDMYQNRYVMIQEQLYRKISECVEEGNLQGARKLVFMDSVHPLQCLAYQHWMDMMETAEYKCSHGLNQPDHYHFGLDIPCYTHFTSPIRRYVDLHVHRLLHADLDGTVPICKPDDVIRLCQHLNNISARQRGFGKGCTALAIAERLQSHPVVFRAFVDSLNSEELTFCLPSLLKVSDRKQEVSFSMLGISCQPVVFADAVQKQDMATVRWGTKIYNKHGLCPREVALKRKHVEQEATVQNRPLSVPLDIDINPYQLTVNVSQTEWAEMLTMLMAQTSDASPSLPSIIERVRSEVNYISSEIGDGSVSARRVRFSMTFSPGQVVPLQMSAEPKKGILRPRVEFVQITRNAGFCTQHISDPVAVLTHSARQSIRDQKLESYKDYKSAWMPLLEMEAAYGAGTGDSAVVIENVDVEMKVVQSAKSPGKATYQGSFCLPANFCFDRGIEFGGKSAGSTGKEHEYKSHSTCPMDYLCIRYRAKCDEATVSRVQQSHLKCVVDDHYTWIGHAGVVAVGHKNRKNDDSGQLHVTFILSRHSSAPPFQLLHDAEHHVTLEVLPKSQVDRRAQEMLFQLEDKGNELAQAITFKRRVPELGEDRRSMGCNRSFHEVDVRGVILPRNNPPQKQAVKAALTHSVSLIQGPPGTGKTYTGIKLIYLFTKINRKLAEDGKGKSVVLFCGPSNKSVDLVARLLKLKFGNECPKMVRVYGSAIESKDYPIPRGDLRYSRGMRDLNSDPELRDVSLHHIIRESGKKFAEEIAAFKAYFDKCRKDPKNVKVTSKMIKDYKRLLYDASVDELAHYEVIFTTCAVGGSRKLVEATKDSIFQVMIDECAMSPEPHSLVPIVANKAKQVVLIGDHKQLRPIITCQAAAELGLDQSLFERLFHKSSVKCVFLSTQYRMHLEICEFPSTEFYKGRLQTDPSAEKAKFILPIWPRHPETSKPVPHILVDVRGEEETLTVSTDEGNERSKSNLAEADKVIEVLIYLKNACEEKKEELDREYNRQLKIWMIETGQKIDPFHLPKNPDNLGYSIKILTQYNAQRHLLEQKLATAYEEHRGLTRYDKNNISVSTVVSSQGGEWDYVILSTVRSLPSYKIEPRPTLGWCRQNMGFITDQNQVNVALTRARRGIIIVGNAELLQCDPVWGRLFTRYDNLGCVYESTDFPPPVQLYEPKRQRIHQPVASLEWNEVRRHPRHQPQPDEVAGSSAAAH